MSRKSKRRRMRQQNAGTEAGREPAESFEFLDDRTAGPSAAAAPRGAVPAATADPRAAGFAPPEPVPAASPAPASPPGPAAAASAAPEAPAVPLRTLGEILTSAREACGLSVEEVSARTRISSKMLLHLENDRFGEFAADAYARGSLRSYGSFLGLDTTELLARFEALRSPAAAPAPQPVWEPEVEAVELRRAGRVRRRPDTRFVVATGVAVVAVAAVAAGVFLVRRGVVHLRPQAGLTQIENELRENRAPDSTAGGVIRTAAADSAATLAPDAPVVPLANGLGEDTAPPLVAARAAERTVEVARPVPQTGATAVRPVQPSVPGASASSARPPATVRGATAPPITDLVEEPEPPASDAAKSAVRRDPLVLTAAARDTCSLRVQIDTEAGRSQQIRLQPGEARSWTARESFRIATRRGSKLDLWVNGRPIAVPGDGRPLRIDHRTLQAEPASPVRSAATRTSRRNRRTAPREAAPTPAAAAAASRSPGPLP